MRRIYFAFFTILLCAFVCAQNAETNVEVEAVAAITQSADAVSVEVNSVDLENIDDTLTLLEDFNDESQPDTEEVTEEVIEEEEEEEAEEVEEAEVDKSSSTKPDPDEKRSGAEIITSKNFPLEIHEVTTEDGWILKLFRIPGAKNSKGKQPLGKPILLQHGLVDSSDSWVANEETLAFPYLLANKGYDVWMGNNRGNKYSKARRTSSWLFSFHEMGLKDDPAMINYILSKNKVSDKITYIGHSQGCSQFMVLCSLNPEYCSQKIHGMIALGPAIFIDHTSSTQVRLMAHSPIDTILKSMGVTQILTSSDKNDPFLRVLCGVLRIACKLTLKEISDSHPSDENKKRLNVFFAHFPSGSSVDCLSHFKKLILRKKFMELKTSKAYPLEKINVPIYVHSGQHDKLVRPVDAKRLFNKLNPQVAKFFKTYKKMGHLTFFLSYGKDDYIKNVMSQVEEINKGK